MGCVVLWVTWLRELRGSVAAWVAWVNFLHGFRGLTVPKYFLHGSTFYVGLIFYMGCVGHIYRCVGATFFCVGLCLS